MAKRQYLRDSSKVVPKTSEWRYKRVLEDGEDPTTTQLSPKRRRKYLRDGSCKVPQSTLWKWKTNDHNEYDGVPLTLRNVLLDSDNDMAEDCGDVGLSSRSDSDSTTDDVTIAGVDANAGDLQKMTMVSLRV